MAIENVMGSWVKEIPGAEKILKGDEVQSKGFMEYLKGSVENVNELLQISDKAATNMAAGKSENLHEAMIDMEKADTALKLMVQVRNKAIEAYHEIIRMQV